MGASRNLVAFDLTAALVMVVIPDSDSELGDPSFTPKNCVNISLPPPQYGACVDFLTFLQACLPAVIQANPQVGQLLQAEIILLQQGQGVVVQTAGLPT